MTTTQLQQHPLSAAYPKMEPKEFDALVADITAHGQLHDCVTLDGMVLDGMTRYRACLAAGIECRFVEYDGTDPRAFVESVNGHRRHLAYWQRSESKRAVAAVLECASWSARGRPKQLGTGAQLNGARAPITEPGEITTSKQMANVSQLTNRQLAEKVGTSVDTIKRAKRAVRAGQGQAVSAGKMTANQAAKQAKPSTVPKRPTESEREKILIEAGICVGKFSEVRVWQALAWDQQELVHKLWSHIALLVDSYFEGCATEGRTEQAVAPWILAVDPNGTHEAWINTRDEIAAIVDRHNARESKEIDDEIMQSYRKLKALNRAAATAKAPALEPC